MSGGKLAGKVAVVTASTAGIGLSIARRFAIEGASVLVSSRNEHNVEQAVAQLQAQGLKVAGCQCHVANPAHRKALLKTAMERFGGVDILVSNAATNPVLGGLLDCPEAGWNKIFDVNVKAAYLLSQLFVPAMKQNNSGGAILLVSSVLGIMPHQLMGAYSVSKMALVGVAKVLAQECAAFNIRVNVLAPGFIKTSFSSPLIKNDAVRQSIVDSVYLKRIGEPDEVAGSAVFLCSEDAAYITGSVLSVDGGVGDVWKMKDPRR